MRLALILALGLVLGGATVALAPTASACTSDPDVICAVIGHLDECGQHLNVKYPSEIVKSCVP